MTAEEKLAWHTAYGSAFVEAVRLNHDEARLERVDAQWAEWPAKVADAAVRALRLLQAEPEPETETVGHVVE